MTNAVHNSTSTANTGAMINESTLQNSQNGNSQQVNKIFKDYLSQSDIHTSNQSQFNYQNRFSVNPV